MKRPDLPAAGRSSSGTDAVHGMPAEAESKPKSAPAPKRPSKSASTARSAKASAPAPNRPKRQRMQPDVDPAKRARADIRAARKRRRADIRAERRRFTAGRRRRRMLIGGAAGVIALLFVAVFGVAYSPLMAVRTISVVGTTTIDPAQIQAALAGEIGTPLPLVNPSDIAQALAVFPAVQSFSTESVPPSTLVVRIVERTPVGSIHRNDQYDLVDAAGVVIRSSPDPIAGVPQLELTDTSSPAFRTVASMLLTLPAEIRSQIVSAGSDSGVDAWFDIANGPHVVWGDGQNNVLKLRVFETLWAGSWGAREINVSAPNSPFTR